MAELLAALCQWLCLSLTKVPALGLVGEPGGAGPCSGAGSACLRELGGRCCDVPCSALFSAPSGPFMGSLTRACPRQQEGASFPGLWLMDAVPLVTVPAEPSAEGAEAAALSALLEGAEILRDCGQTGL